MMKILYQPALRSTYCYDLHCFLKFKMKSDTAFQDRWWRRNNLKEAIPGIKSQDLHEEIKWHHNQISPEEENFL